MTLIDKALLCIFVLCGVGCVSSQVNPLHYIDVEKPTLLPKVFAPQVISKAKQSEFGSTFSKDGKEFFYAVNVKGKSELRYTKLDKGAWTSPVVLFANKKYKFADPFLSPDETELYFISDMQLNKADTILDHDIWYAKKQNNKWSAPINAGKKINSAKNEYYVSFTSEGTMYFSSNKNASANREHDFDIYYSKRIAGVYQDPVKLGDAINTKRYEADVFIAPDESYIIFSTARKDGFGNGDLYISFKNATGAWSTAKNMGAVINTKSNELCPFVSKDGKYLFYTSNSDIYWVDAKLIDSYR